MRVYIPKQAYDEYDVGPLRAWYGPPQKSSKPKYVVFAADNRGQWIDHPPVLAWAGSVQQAVAEVIANGEYRIDPSVISTVFVVPLCDSPYLGWYVDIKKVS